MNSDEKEFEIDCYENAYIVRKMFLKVDYNYAYKYASK